MGRLLDRNTLDPANAGKRLRIYNPDGTPTEDWLQVRHIWSDAFQLANDKEVAAIREVMLANPDDVSMLDEAKREGQLRVWASLVSDWSDDEPCSAENIIKFLRKNPDVGQKIDKFAADSRRFFGNDSTSSDAGSSQNAS